VAILTSPPFFDGEEVVVDVRGFDAGAKVWLSECPSVAVASDLGCGAELARQVFIVVDQAGRGRYTFVLSSHAALRGLGETSTPCLADCVLVATEGDGRPHAIGSIVAFVETSTP
jgi:hypothetical protein